MTNPIEDDIREALLSHAKGHIDKHVMNVKILMKKCVGVAEHGDVLEEIEKELKIIAEYHDEIEMINTYINPPNRYANLP
jgi:hypothetical protein